ncbi:glycosyltransferase [Methylovirgula sp. 4M-Z18]|uniref:glycosyltransferase n=1 Tax=Methylovirgula sp. 4M-Z18 TaxID=2293567 RepID=UPI001313F87E|nr:glycosyltransferase [Methylovirgula sp. 4M-Z18]
MPEHLRIVPAEQAFERREWNHRRAHYDILEFATSVKPACFRFLFRRGVERAIYLDPDIRLFRRLDLFSQGDQSDDELVLTPHILSPLPDDGHRPDDLAIMRAGLYNLGFAAMRNTPDARALLEWWDAKLHDRCLQDVREGVFTDQKWMDYAPLMLTHSKVLQHLGFNVAYWNLHERIPRNVGGHWQVEGWKGGSYDLVFFHFSGFAPGRKGISRHENRFGCHPPGDAAQLFDDYAEALTSAGLPYFGALEAPRVSLHDGIGWDPACRALYRQAIAKDLDLGDPLDEPGFLEWAAGRAPNDHVTRYIRTVLWLRSDVAAAYDDGRDTAGLRAWMRGSGVSEMGLDSTLVERFIGEAASGLARVNYVGYLRAHLGVGEAARQSVVALEAAGVAVRIHDISAAAAAPIGGYVLPEAPAAESQARVTILGCNADALPGVLPALPSDLLDTYRVGCWYWETPTFPEQWSDRFDLVDEIWVATRFVAEAIREKATVPVVVMPPMVRPPSARRDRAWLATLLPEVTREEFVFLFQFDIASTPFRKNPEGLIAAFSQAFSPEEPVRLVLKLLNGHAEPDLVDDLRNAAAGRRISIFDAALESADRFRLLASVDSFVSLHRSEGFGLSIAEAMAYGLPVVATGWSGNADFTTAANAALVPYDLVPGARAYGPYPAGTLWAEPRLDAAAQLMRRVWTDKAWREAIGQAGAATIERLYSATTVGEAMRVRLQRIERSARVRTRQTAQRQALSEPQVAQAAVRKPVRLSRIARDVFRFPGYYLMRLPRLPALLWQSGVSNALIQAELVAAGSPEFKRQYRISLVPVALAARWRSWRRDRRSRSEQRLIS